MTESEWLTSDNPERMLQHLGFSNPFQPTLDPSTEAALRCWVDACRSMTTGTVWTQQLSWAAFTWATANRRWDADCPRSTRAALLRCIVGNPFRPLSRNPIWLTPTVSNLIEAVCEEGIMASGQLDPDRLAVLSDALEEAGCDDADILNHLRSPGRHVRGCWAVDLLLGRT